MVEPDQMAASRSGQGRQGVVPHSRLQHRIQERVRKKCMEGSKRPKTGSLASFEVSFRDFNPLNAFTWSKLFGEPTDQDVNLMAIPGASISPSQASAPPGP